MSQTLIVELNDDVELDENTADQLKTLIDRVKTGKGVSKLRVELTSDQPLPIQITESTEITETIDEASTEEREAEVEESEDEHVNGDVRLNPDTRRWILASILYHTDEPLQVSEIVDLSEGEEWEMNQSQASAELYGMLNDELVDREGSPYAYELTEKGENRLEKQVESTGTEIEPNPF